MQHAAGKPAADDMRNKALHAISLGQAFHGSSPGRAVSAKERTSIVNPAQMTADMVGVFRLFHWDGWGVHYSPNRLEFLDWRSVASSGDEGKSEFPDGVWTGQALESIANMQLRGLPLRVPGDFRQFHPPLLFSLAKDFFIPVDVANSITAKPPETIPGQSLSAISPFLSCGQMRGTNAVGSPDPLSGKSCASHQRVSASTLAFRIGLVAKGGSRIPGYRS
ncbi:uncharacterized protein BO96DRAFT_466675 [Aspergillus niger CBS 101883]|uniref:uncharacterized protein n=1 Tax=Aspergillus lacticoffeatus (strain CBS 101883) TaxID=1450533 RepID=UPI000D7FEC05|nr:uncharacterized protein BO96DRAFT_466675 [Aspergillus niger CBS 101883]PYH55856.1 hypothetical protein BO96DRAFT_466675 [Aspergillus niger CBS 101883]